jgi:transcriptional regulator with XRE-family HTH domain
VITSFSTLWPKLRDKTYRESFVAAQVKRGIPFQIRTLLKHQHLSQSELAERADLTQGVVSRAANPNYGNLTLNTIIRIAAGFDVAFIGRFVPFSELDRWYRTLSEEECELPTFAEEDTGHAGCDVPDSTSSIARLEDLPPDYVNCREQERAGAGPALKHVLASQQRKSSGAAQTIRGTTGRSLRLPLPFKEALSDLLKVKPPKRKTEKTGAKRKTLRRSE